MSDKAKRQADEQAIEKGRGRRNNEAASKGGSQADSDTRKALGNLRRLIGG